MKLQTEWRKHTLEFTFKAGTSRGVLTEHNAYYIILKDSSSSAIGIGEASPLPGLSPEYGPNFELRLVDVLKVIEETPLPVSISEIGEWVQEHIPEELPSVRFGVETALRDLLNAGQRRIFPSIFQSNTFPPILINGLVWMGDREFMLEQINEKIAQGFDCIKLKIGAINFETELSLLDHIRNQYPKEVITLRVDANGAFTPNEALAKFNRLAEFDLHSIEQPIAAGQAAQMHQLCCQTPVPIALDEELIGVYRKQRQVDLLDKIQPQYIILKPTLVGGLSASQQWIELAEERGIGWWLTSALESNIGLNAIAQLAAYQRVTTPQGLGTGQLYHNNIPSPLTIKAGKLHYDPSQDWDLTKVDRKVFGPS